MTAAAQGVALVTGASSGIGRELAMLAAADRYNLVLVARDKKGLAALAGELTEAHGIRAEIFACDLTEPDAVHSIVKQLDIWKLDVEILINNAGYGLGGPFATEDPAKLRGMLLLNTLALTELTRALLPGMTERGRGKILNVASLAGYFPGPYMAAYYATKAYVLSLSRALREELRGSGVTVTALCPGPTKTHFAQTAGVEGSRLFSGRLLTAEQVAAAGYRGMMANRASVVPGINAKITAFISFLTPPQLMARVVARLQRP